MLIVGYVCMSARMFKWQAHVHRARPVVAEDGTLVVTEPELLHRMCGTMSYAPPEILAGIPYCGYTADVWSLGVCLFGLMVRISDKLEYSLNISTIYTPGILAWISTAATPPMSGLCGRLPLWANCTDIYLNIQHTHRHAQPTPALTYI